MQTDEPLARAICGAKTRSGGVCQNAPMPNGRCRMHGGKSLSGAAHPNFRTGRYSKYLPQRLLERYNDGLNDPDLLTLADDISLLTARLEELLQKIDSNDTGAGWKLVKATYAKLKTAIKAGDALNTAQRMNELERQINTSTTEWALWGEISLVLEQRRRLVETERRLLVEHDRVVTVDQLMIMVGALQEVIRTHVHDRNTLAAIASDIRSTLLVEPGRRS